MATEKFPTTRFNNPGALLIVGSEWFQDSMGGMLKEFHHKLWYGANCNVVFDQARNEKIDLLLVEEPGDKTGYAFCKEVKDNAELTSIPVVLVCHRRGPKALEHAFDHGASDAITLPVTQAILNARVKIHLKYRNAVSELNETLGRLEERVENRTSEWKKANEQLKKEMIRREQIQAALRAKEEEIRQAQKLEVTGQLAGGIAHDFNNLLTIIKGHCELIAGQLPKNASQQGNLREINRAARRAADLVQQLLAFSRKQILKPEVLNLNALLEAQLDMIGRTLGESILITTKFRPRLGAIKADKGQVEQALLNIILNAKDAMPEGGRLNLETRNVVLKEPWTIGNDHMNPGPYVKIDISDNGCGMDESTRLRIFEPFFTTKGTGKGTGLGLSVAYGTVRQSGGGIQVTSEPRKGATFELFFPRVDAVPSSAATSATLDAVIGKKETLLLVEDEDAVRALLVDSMKGYGYTVHSAPNGQEALTGFKDMVDRIDLLVTDVVMPIMGGRELAESLRAIRPDLRVLYMSGYAPDQYFLTEKQEAGSAFLGKPFSAHTLAMKIGEILGGP